MRPAYLTFVRSSARRVRRSETERRLFWGISKKGEVDIFAGRNKTAMLTIPAEFHGFSAENHSRLLVLLIYI